MHIFDARPARQHVTITSSSHDRIKAALSAVIVVFGAAKAVNPISVQLQHLDTGAGSKAPLIRGVSLIN